jgi:phospholipid/cholesterol/gamma-HCH transport system ATP-binding protein
MVLNKALSVKNLVVRYNSELILDDISFSVNQGDIFIIMGGSGAGKSTLLRHMVGLEKPCSGDIFIGNTNIFDTDEPTFTNILKKIGVLFQGSALLGSMTVGENVALPVFEHLKIEKRLVPMIVRMKLSMVGLACYEQHLPSEISGGMKKRAGLARAMALNPDILFLDEPSAGLDPVTAAGIDDLILHINKTLGTTIIIVTHDLDSIFTVGKNAILLDMKTKKIIARGDPHMIKDNHDSPEVRNFFRRKAASLHP